MNSKKQRCMCGRKAEFGSEKLRVCLNCFNDSYEKRLIHKEALDEL